MNSSGADKEKLSAHAIRNIKRALDDVKNGRVYSTEEAKRRLGIK